MRAITSAAYVTALCLAILIWTPMPAAVASTSTGCLPASLKNTLAQIRQRFGPVRIVSTHRPGARIAGSGRRSLHASCRAVDFHPPAGKYAQVLSWLRSNHSGGLGTYSGSMHHIHIDNGARVVFHHSTGRRYASNRGTNRGRSKRTSSRAASARWTPVFGSQS